MGAPVLLLARSEIAALLAPDDYLGAVEAGFRALHSGRANTPQPMHLPAAGGGFHAKGATFASGRAYVALKFNGNFPDNPARGLATIQGAILLCDADDGSVLAILDSAEITLRRTAAASALAAKHLAKPRARTLTLYGCGVQGRAHADALAALFPFEAARCWDVDQKKAVALAAEIELRLGIRARAVASVAEASDASDIVVACTSATQAYLGPFDVTPGAFIAAVGADSPAKSELTPALMRRARVIVDNLEQCATMGDLHHAIAAGAMHVSDVRADLGEIVSGEKVGRQNDDDIVVFDSTGLAIEDAASAALAYERARAAGVGMEFLLSGG